MFLEWGMGSLPVENSALVILLKESGGGREGEEYVDEESDLHTAVIQEMSSLLLPLLL